jgi:hypothetical protein
MKLRNKKTGEIKEWTFSEWLGQITNPNNEAEYECNLVEFMKRTNNFCEEWEEPKEYYFINSVGGVIRPSDTDDWEQEDAAHHKQIGNYFETKEEAEKAVEKLKAWKRLKDKGFRIRRNNYHDGMMYLHIWNDTTDEITPLDKKSETFKDLDLLFGGEE